MNPFKLKSEAQIHPSCTPQSIFVERYEWLFGWALKMTSGDRAEAEDILHDAYVHFLRMGTPLSEIKNLDGYLHRMVRNLYLSKVKRRTRTPMVEIDAFEYDSLDLSVAAIDPFRFAPVQEELQHVCDWACHRRVETRTASILLLRFFLRYLPSEIATICQSNRQGVEKSLQLARKEIKIFLCDMQAPGARTKKSDSLRGSNRPHVVREREASLRHKHGNLESMLRAQIFAVAIGDCPHAQGSEETGVNLSPVDRDTLAHLTSCKHCLDRTNRHFGLPLLAERFMDEEIIDDDGDYPGMNTRGDSSRNASKPSTIQVIERGERMARSLHEHRPKHLSVHVEGERRASLSLRSDSNQFTMEIGKRHTVHFVEVFSEQGLRLAYLPITSLEEGGEYAQSVEVGFSEDRILRLEVRFSQPRPSISIWYEDPLFQMLDAEAGPALVPVPTLSSFPLREIAQATSRWNVMKEKILLSFNTMPRAVLIATLIVLIALIPLLRTERPVLAAETLLKRSEEWQRTSGQSADHVLHRSFDYYEQSSENDRSKPSKHRRVELWRQETTGRKLRKLFDDKGKLLDTSTSEPAGRPNHDDVWQYVPSVEAFRLEADPASARVETEKGFYRLRTSNLRMELDATTYRPTRSSLDLGNVHIEMKEIATESIPLKDSPLMEPVAPVEESHRVERPSANLDLTEMLVRTRLHELHADMGEDIRISRTPQSVLVLGVVNSEFRRDELKGRLAEVPNVVTKLQSPEEAEASSGSGIHRVIDASGDHVTPPLLNAWLQESYPNESARSTFIERVLSEADQCMWHARALRVLLLRFGTIDEPTVHAIANDHIHSLREKLSRVHTSTEGFPGVDDTSVPAESPVPITLAERTQKIDQLSRDLNEHLSELLTAHQQEQGRRVPETNLMIDQCRRDVRQLEELTKRIN